MLSPLKTYGAKKHTHATNWQHQQQQQAVTMNGVPALSNSAVSVPLAALKEDGGFHRQTTGRRNKNVELVGAMQPALRPFSSSSLAVLGVPVEEVLFPHYSFAARIEQSHGLLQLLAAQPQA